MTDLTSSHIKDNVARVQERITAACARANRDPAQITLVAVSKKKPASAVLAALAAGLQHFGENRVEESQMKLPQVKDHATNPITWHMIGHIQSRKARFIPHLFDVVHSVDSLKLAGKLSALALDRPEPLPVFVQVNVSGEEQKYGFDAYNWRQDAAVLERITAQMRDLVALPGLQIRGLMTMAPFIDEGGDIETTRPVFADLAALRETLVTSLKVPLPDLSMGMTDDYPVAIEEGATVVRIGRAIFGEREPT